MMQNIVSNFREPQPFLSSQRRGGATA